jgi:ferredoxin
LTTGGVENMVLPYPSIDPGCCSHCGGCSEVAPAVFRYNPETALFEVLPLAEYPRAEVDEAIRYCPEKCICWEGAIERGGLAGQGQGCGLD